MKPTKQHAKKILELLDYGLIAGIGKPIPGQMHVEAVSGYDWETEFDVIQITHWTEAPELP